MIKEYPIDKDTLKRIGTTDNLVFIINEDTQEYFFENKDNNVKSIKSHVSSLCPKYQVWFYTLNKPIHRLVYEY